MELIYSKEWEKKEKDRKDFTYSPLSKNLVDAMYFPVDSKEHKLLLIKIIDNKLECLK